MKKRVIVNADDFGLTESCSKAIMEAFRQGLISSTTACATGTYIREAYELALQNGFADRIGIHINLTEGIPLTEQIRNDPFFCTDGKYHGRINRLKKPSKEQIEEVREEVLAQIQKLRKIGFDLTHADSHHHIHTDVFLEKAIAEVLLRSGITKIRLHRNIGNIAFYKKIVKNIYNRILKRQGFLTTERMGSAEDWKNLSDSERDCFCEIMVHPDFDGQGRLIDRIDYEEDIPVGTDLQELEKLFAGKEKISYREF